MLAPALVWCQLWGFATWCWDQLVIQELLVPWRVLQFNLFLQALALITLHNQLVNSESESCLWRCSLPGPLNWRRSIQQWDRGGTWQNALSIFSKIIHAQYREGSKFLPNLKKIRKIRLFLLSFLNECEILLRSYNLRKNNFGKLINFNNMYFHRSLAQNILSPDCRRKKIELTIEE